MTSLGAIAWGVVMRPKMRAKDLVVARRAGPAIRRAYTALWKLDRDVPPHVASTRPDDPETTWGETPLSTAMDVLSRAGVTADSHIVDVGAGRGMVLLGARALGASAHGVELDPRRGLPAKDVLAPLDVVVDVGDARVVLTDEALARATHVWLSWTCMDDVTRAAIAAQCARVLKPASTLIALTWEPRLPFHIIESFEAPFSWGRATVIIARLLTRSRRT